MATLLDGEDDAVAGWEGQETTLFEEGIFETNESFVVSQCIQNHVQQLENLQFKFIVLQVQHFFGRNMVLKYALGE